MCRTRRSPGNFQIELLNLFKNRKRRKDERDEGQEMEQNGRMSRTVPKQWRQQFKQGSEISKIRLIESISLSNFKDYRQSPRFLVEKFQCVHKVLNNSLHLMCCFVMALFTFLALSVHTLTIFLFGIRHDVYASFPTTNEVASRCCSKEYVECCEESIDFVKPLRCYGMELGTRINVTLCIQKAMYGEDQSMLNLTDTVCCDVFADDDNDEKRHCLTECITAMQIPTLKNDQKLKRIKECRRKNLLYKCFNRCLRWLHNNTEDEALIFDRDCSIKLKMLPGKVSEFCTSNRRHANAAHLEFTWNQRVTFSSTRSTSREVIVTHLSCQWRQVVGAEVSRRSEPRKNVDWTNLCMSMKVRLSAAEVMSQIRRSPAVRLNTGNIQRHSELFRQMFKNSAEELLAALEHQINGPDGPNLEIRPDGTVMLARDSENCRLNTIEKADMKITLKVFMSSLDIKQVEESIDTALRETNTKTVSQLIIAFPPDDSLDIDPSVPSQVHQWLSRILPFWRQLETLVNNHKVHTLGVADLEYEQLKALYESTSDHQPMINHYNTEHCCTVPPELREYAKQKDIQLLTHNDSSLCSIKEHLGKTIKKLLGDENFELLFIARLTVWLRSRSIIVGKGYILKFLKNIS
uniref:GCS light chain n=1 Tax=Setaria digitata TaxID=48799 RepID=A0A915Q4M5_9BILA